VIVIIICKGNSLMIAVSILIAIKRLIAMVILITIILMDIYWCFDSLYFVHDNFDYFHWFYSDANDCPDCSCQVYSMSHIKFLDFR